MEMGDALIHYYLNIDPDELDDDQWVKYLNRVVVVNYQKNKTKENNE